MPSSSGKPPPRDLARPATEPLILAPLPVPASIALSIYEHLRQQILSGGMSGGTRLQQAELARRYGVSITPVREALAALSSDGFVDANPFSGFTVHQPTLKELDDIYALRAELTPMMVRLAVANITPEKLAQAQQLAASMTEGMTTWAEANRDFHLALESSCDNAQLVGTMSRLADVSRGYVALSMASSAVRQRQANDEHVELVAMYEQRDAEGAIAATLHHISETHRLVREVFAHGLEEQPTPDDEGPRSPTRRALGQARTGLTKQ